MASRRALGDAQRPGTTEWLRVVVARRRATRHLVGVDLSDVGDPRAECGAAVVLERRRAGDAASRRGQSDRRASGAPRSGDMRTFVIGAVAFALACDAGPAAPARGAPSADLSPVATMPSAWPNEPRG